MKLSERDYKIVMHNEWENLILPVLGLAYFIWMKFTHTGFPCVFRLITGWKCPGCGITHMIMDLMQGDFRQAFHANAFLFLTWPFIIVEWIGLSILHQYGKMKPAWNEVLLYVYIAFLCGFGVLRNIYGW